MAQIRIERVLALPALNAITASTMYIVQGVAANDAELYFSNNDGTAVRHLPTNAEIDTKIATAITAANNIVVVADIAARDALAPSTTVLALVLDATGDGTVETGSALYVFQPVEDVWTKVSEYESLDLTLNWTSIVGRPTSDPVDIDAAVAARHTHANKTVLDDLADAAGVLTYKGDPVGNFLAVSQW